MNKQDNNSSSADDLIHKQEFGSCLCAARQAAGLSVYDVASALKLSEKVIKSLESSQVDLLPAPTFTQGYIRSYSRLLNLSADEIIKAYILLLPEQETPLSINAILPSQKTSNDLSVKMVTYGMALIGFVLMVIWWYQTDFNWIESTEKHKTESANQHIDNPITENTVFKSSQSESKQRDLVETKAVGIINDVKTFNIDNVSVKNKNIEDLISENLNAIVAPTGEDVLVLSALADSWVEIDDANDHRLLFELIKKDQIQQIQGKSPFRIFLGNAPVVTVQLNNQSINISAHVRKNNIAHIEIYSDGSVVNVRRQNKQSKPENSSEHDVFESDVSELNVN